jgi:hypothetical protein
MKKARGNKQTKADGNEAAWTGGDMRDTLKDLQKEGLPCSLLVLESS